MRASLAEQRWRSATLAAACCFIASLNICGTINSSNHEPTIVACASLSVDVVVAIGAAVAAVVIGGRVPVAGLESVGLPASLPSPPLSIAYQTDSTLLRTTAYWEEIATVGFGFAFVQMWFCVCFAFVLAHCTSS